MAGATETVTIGQVTEWVRSLGGVTFDFTPALALCRLAIISSIKENFAGSHAPDGSAWKPLKHPRPNSKGADKPLRNTGILMGSVTSRSGRGNIDNLEPNRLEYGSNLEYAATQQDGATIFPSAAKYLAIPLTQEAANTSGPRAWGGAELRFRPFGRGKRGGVLYEPKKKGSRNEAVSHYLLVSSVTIPARPFLGWNEDLLDEVTNILADGVARAILNAKIDPTGKDMKA